MIKMGGVVAVPGEFSYGDRTERKTVEELKEAAFRHPIVPLSYGHTVDGLQPPASMQIGTVSQKWSTDHNAVMGEFWLHEEKIPDVLRKKIDNGEKIPISAGLILESVDEDGTQRGIGYTHIAVLDGEDPKCPLGVCGMNVRLESDRLVRLDKSTEITPPEPKAEKEPEVAPEEVEEITERVKKEDKTPFGDVPTEPEETEPETPVVQKPEEPSEQAEEEEVRLEPEVVIPTESVVVQKGPGEFVDDNYVFESFKQKEKTK